MNEINQEKVSNMPLCLNFPELPIYEIFEMFQHFGVIILRSFLANERFTIDEFFPLKYAEIMGKQTIKTKRSLFNFLFFFRSNNNIKLTGISDLTLNRIRYKIKYSGDEWIDKVLNRLAMEIGDHKHYLFPSELLPVIAEAAWSDLKFQHHIASKLRDILRKNYIFKPGHIPVPYLSINFFWALIVFADIIIIKSQKTLKKNRATHKIINKSLERLQKKGIEISMIPEWAGFWDQWTFSKYNIWNQQPEIKKSAVQLYNALRSLPFISAKFSFEKEQDSKIPKLASLDWEKDKPIWMNF